MASDSTEMNSGTATMTKLFHRTSMILAALLLITGCQEQQLQHPAMGNWSASMVSGGVVVDIGTVEVGNNNLNLPDSNIRRQALDTRITGNSIHFSDPADPSFSAQVRLINNTMASMQMQGINGYIDLTREG
jgi:hypothetical protein